MSPSKALFYGCISFVVGIALESFIAIPQILIFGVFVLGLVMVTFSFLRDKNNFLVFGFCLLALVLGIMRLQVSQFIVTNDPLAKLNGAPGKVALVGRVADEPDVRDTSQKLKVKIHDSVVLVTTGRYPQYHYLDTVQIKGKLKTPAVFDDFNYKNYLLKDGIYSVMDYPVITSVSTKHDYNIFTFAYDNVLFFKGKLRDSIYVNFSGPRSQLLEGVILGNNKNMSSTLRDKLNIAGLRYLTAISGVHVLILSIILMSLFLFLGFWRGQAFYIAIVFIWLYVVLTGFTASGIRAAIMGSIFMTAEKLGRQNTSARTITLAGALMLLQNPMLLLYDVGFQLSFLACLGIIYIKPFLQSVIKMVTKEHAAYLIDMLCVTLAAQVFILPIMVYNFGNVSLVAPITSLLVLPIMPVLMVLGFLGPAVGIFSTVLGWAICAPCWVLLTYFITILNIFSGPWALANWQNVSWLWPVAYYVILFPLIIFLQKYRKPEFLGY